MSARPNLFTIGPHRPFLDQLAQSWLVGELDVGPPDDPLARIDTTFYLPTRRAARAFGDILTQALGGTALLPAIRTLADAQEDEFLLPMSEDGRLAVAPEALEPPNLATMPALRRRLMLTRLVEAAGTAMRRAMAEAGLAEAGMADPPAFPQSVSESAHLAGALADLIDQVATEESDCQALFELVPQDHAAYWQLTLTLLTLVTQNWPDILAQEGVVDPATRRRLLLDARTARILAGAHRGPVIAAGSTGSIPATARLLAAIARARQGAVVLPGLDLSMADEAFAGLGEETPETASHPQHGLCRLLATMQASRADVRDLSAPVPERQRLVSAALLPAPATGRWPALRPAATGAFDGVQLVEAPGEAEESLAIAMAMKSALAQGQSVALVTPDRTLARRVQLDLQRFGLSSDDSAGTPLRETMPARLVLLAAQAWRSGFAAVPMLALLKHPLTALGCAPSATRAEARLLERLALRGPALAPGLAAMRTVIALRAGERGKAGIHVPALRRTLGPGDDARALALLDRLEAAFAPLAALAPQARGVLPLADYAAALFAVCEALAATGQDAAPTPLHAGPAGEALAALRVQLAEAAPVALTLPAAQAPDLLETLMADIMVRPDASADPRLAIWGPLEARLMRVDHVILGGLNEKVWPALPAASPFLSRAMMAGLALAIPERRIGLSAHDVEQALGQARVTLTRARKVDGAPTVASRWLQRLLAFLPQETGAAMRERARPLLAAAAAWDSPPQMLQRPRPQPRPANPPTRLSITDVETLIRDPYAIYARRVLRLEESPTLGLPPGPAERGTLFHGLFEAMAPLLDSLPPEDWAQAMQAQAETVLAALEPFADIRALWTQRIARIIPPFLLAEAGWSDGLVRRHAELAGTLDLTLAGHACRLTGRADRIDLYADGTAAILDFKTGAMPGVKEMKTLSPQLPLGAAMLMAGAFEGLAAHRVRAARYVQASGNRQPLCIKGIEDQDELAQTAARARDQLQVLWTSFLMGAPFTSMLRPQRTRDEGRYHQLARVKEWRVADEAFHGSAEGEGP